MSSPKAGLEPIQTKCRQERRRPEKSRSQFGGIEFRSGRDRIRGSLAIRAHADWRLTFMELESEMNISKVVALALYCSALSLSSSALAAPADDGRGGWIERICAKTPDPARREQRLARLAERLHLTDAEKDLFKAYQDARAAARKSAIDSICANKPDLKTLEGRLAFRQRILENRLSGAKASDPKLLAFYNSLDNGQKALFDDLRRRWRHHKGHRQHGWREDREGQSVDRGRRDRHRSQDD